MHKQIAHVIELEVRDQVIDAINDRLQRLIQPQRYLVEMTAQEQNSEDKDESDGVIGGGRGEDERAKESHGNDDAEHTPVEREGLKTCAEGPLAVARGADH